MASLCDGRCCEDVDMPYSVKHLSSPYLAFADKDFWIDAVQNGVYNEEDKLWHYNCRFHDEETKLCTIYEDRPSDCRAFPREGSCKYCGETNPELEREV